MDLEKITVYLNLKDKKNMVTNISPVQCSLYMNKNYIIETIVDK